MLRDCLEECPCPKDPRCEHFNDCDVCVPRHYKKDTLPYCERDVFLDTLTPERREEILQIFSTQNYK